MNKIKLNKIQKKLLWIKSNLNNGTNHNKIGIKIYLFKGE